MQDRLNDVDKIYHSSVDILYHYWRPGNGKLMLKASKILGLDEDTHNADTFKV